MVDVSKDVTKRFKNLLELSKKMIQTVAQSADPAKISEQSEIVELARQNCREHVNEHPAGSLKRREVISDLLVKVETKLKEQKVSIPAILDDAYAGFVGSIGYYLHKELGTLSNDSLSEVKKKLTNNGSFKQSVLGDSVKLNEKESVSTDKIKETIRKVIMDEYKLSLKHSQQSTVSQTAKIEQDAESQSPKMHK